MHTQVNIKTKLQYRLYGINTSAFQVYVMPGASQWLYSCGFMTRKSLPIQEAMKSPLSQTATLSYAFH